LRKVVVLVMSLILVFSLWSACSAEKTCKQQPVKVLFLVDGCCHDFVNLPKMLAEKFQANGEFTFTITKDRDELIPSRITKYDLALIDTQGSDMTKEQEKGLTEFVANGKGYAGIHSASDSFKNSDAYWKMVGGRFIGHGSGTFPVHFTVKRNEIVRGMKDFEIKDETYKHEFHPDAKLVVLARRATDGDPSVWIQYYGKGRVFFTGLGHGKEAWENPSFQELMLKGMRWAVGRPVDAPVCCSSK
jgi:uncharacterized protein